MHFLYRSMLVLMFVATGAAVSVEAAGRKPLYFESSFESPRTSKETTGVHPLDWTLPFIVGDQDQQFIGLTRAGARTKKQSFFVNLRNNDGGTGFGAAGVFKEFPIVGGLEEGQRFSFEVYMASDPKDPIQGGFATIRLEFYGPMASTLIYRTDEDPDHEYATIDEYNASTTFKKFYVDYTVSKETIPDPSKVKLLKIVIGGDTDGNSGKGRVLFDDATFQEIVEEDAR